MASRERDEHIKKLMEQGAKQKSATRTKNSSRGASSSSSGNNKPTSRTRVDQSPSSRTNNTATQHRSSQNNTSPRTRTQKAEDSVRDLPNNNSSSARSTSRSRNNSNNNTNKNKAAKKSLWKSMFSKSKNNHKTSNAADNITKPATRPQTTYDHHSSHGLEDSIAGRNQYRTKYNRSNSDFEDVESDKKNDPKFQKHSSSNLQNSDFESNSTYDINSENTPDSKVWLALCLIFISGYLMICCVSHLIYWDVDQSLSNWGAFAKAKTAMNWGSTLGAILSNEIISRGFGVAGLLLPWAILLGAIKVLRIPSLRITRGIISTLFVMLILSVGLGHFAGYNSNLIGGGLGGELGVYAADWLNQTIGYAGSTLLLCLVFIGIAYFAWRTPIMNMYAIMSEKWNKISELYNAKREMKLSALREKTAESQLRTQQIIASKREAELEAQTLREKLQASGSYGVDLSNSAANNDNESENITSDIDSNNSAPSVLSTTANSSVISEPSKLLEAKYVDGLNNLDNNQSIANEYIADTNTQQVINNSETLITNTQANNTKLFESPNPNLVESIYEIGRYGYLAGYDSSGQDIIYYWVGQVENEALNNLDKTNFSESCSKTIPSNSVIENAKTVRIDTINEDEYMGDDVEITILSKVHEDINPSVVDGSNDIKCETIICNADRRTADQDSMPTNIVNTLGNDLDHTEINGMKSSINNDDSSNNLSTIEPQPSHSFSIKNSEAITTDNQNNGNHLDQTTNTIENPKQLETTACSSQPDQKSDESNTNSNAARFAPSKDDPNFIVELPIQEEEVDEDTINLSELYDPTLELARYSKPPIELLANHSRQVTVTEDELIENKNRIVTTLENFGIKIDTIEATIGPTVTLYEIIPAPGVRISKIKNLEDDIALSLSALGIRIIAPIPGKGTIGIEVPNKDKEVVSMYSVIRSAKFQESRAELPIALGKTIQNETFVMDLAKMPHLLVAGATGQGKSVGLNAIITSLLYKKHPSELKFILVDPKKVELSLYSMLEKHFLAKLPDAEEAIITDTQKVIYTLNSLCIEMDSRYDLLKAAKVRNIIEYNEKFINRRLNPNKGHRFLPYFVVVVDEFADLIMTAGREIETPIARIAQLARAVGIHLIIATQRPTTNIITGVIKANFPARIAFRVSSMIDSRTILDSPGANQLIGKGDMLVSSGSEMTRVQCAFIDTPEVEMIAEHIGLQKGYPTAYELPEYVPEGDSSGSSISEDVLNKRDSLFEEVARYVVSNDNGSASTIQRKFSIGFNRAGRIMDQLEAAGIVSRAEGSKPRQVLIQDILSLEHILNNL